MKELDERGKQCPIPVIETGDCLKKAAPGEKVLVKVDNEIAVQNLQKFARQKGYGFSSKKISDSEFEAELTSENGAEAPKKETVRAEEKPEKKDSGNGRTVVVISSDCMGGPEEELGKILLKGFIYALSKQENVPDTILFYNGGARITCEGSASLEDLRTLENSGCEIMTCGTCLDYQGLKEKLKVGTVTNMYEITERMTAAGRLVRP